MHIQMHLHLLTSLLKKKKSVTSASVILFIEHTLSLPTFVNMEPVSRSFPYDGTDMDV